MTTQTERLEMYNQAQQVFEEEVQDTAVEWHGATLRGQNWSVYNGDSIEVMSMCCRRQAQIILFQNRRSLR